MNNDHTPAASTNGDKQQHAPWLPIPSRAISAVEHPCIVKNIDKGIASLGGPVKLSKGLSSKLEHGKNTTQENELPKIISVSLRPDDPFAKRLLSTAVTTSNLLLKVTVSKRTGRKRKRGSSGLFLTEDEIRNAANDESNGTNHQAVSNYVDASTIYRCLQDNAETYKVALAGVVDETHRFRSMPDLQYTAAHDQTMINLRDNFMPMRHSQLKDIKLNMAAGADLTRSVGPSAEFLQMPVAFNYRLKQNIYVKYTNQGVISLQKSLAFSAYTIIKPTDEHVPTAPNANLPPVASLTPYMQTLIAQISTELEKRPIITRHLLYNKLGWDKRNRLRQAAVYCGYFFESGPWREAIVQWGVDPRSDPKYRMYQTVSFQSYLKTGLAKHHKTFDEHVQRLARMSAAELQTQHIFDGKTASDTGNLFQFCDITDPLIAKLLATDDIRTACAPTFQGWYHVGTWAKVTVILKDKMNTIIGSETPDDTIYARIITWPELWDDKEIAATYKAEMYNRQVHHERLKEHNIMYSVRLAARNPRYAFEKMEARIDQQDDTTQEEQEAIEDTEILEDMTETLDTAEAILNEGEKEAEDPEDYNEEDGDAVGDVEDEGEVEEQDADDDEDDDDDIPIMSARAVSEGPAPFGGLYRV